jgi:hypothetical protein
VSAVTLVFLASLTTQPLVWFGRFTLTGVQTNLPRLCGGSSFTFLMFRFRWANPRLTMLGGFAYPIFDCSMCSAPPAPACWQSGSYQQPPHPVRARTACGLALSIAVDLIFQRNGFLRRVFLGRREYYSITLRRPVDAIACKIRTNASNWLDASNLFDILSVLQALSCVNRLKI